MDYDRSHREWLDAVRTLSVGGATRDGYLEWIIPTPWDFDSAVSTEYGSAVLTLRYDTEGSQEGGRPLESFEIALTAERRDGGVTGFQLVEFRHEAFALRSRSGSAGGRSARSRPVTKVVAQSLYDEWSRAVLGAGYGNAIGIHPPCITLVLRHPEVGTAVAISSVAAGRGEAQRFMGIAKILREHIRSGSADDEERLLQRLAAARKAEAQ